MNSSSSSLRDLARRLLAAEAEQSPQDLQHAAARVCEKLRRSLTRFAGADGFASLLRRSLTLARADVPELRDVQIDPDGSLAGLEELAARERRPGSDVAEGPVAITAHLLGLLVTFIGQPLTMSLVREAWPETPLDELQEDEPHE